MVYGILAGGHCSRGPWVRRRKQDFITSARSPAYLKLWKKDDVHPKKAVMTDIEMVNNKHSCLRIKGPGIL